MKIEKTTVTKHLLTKLSDLDPISEICEDLGPRQGKIIIECYDAVWSAYWGGIGRRSIADFFCSCDEYYLAKNLSSISSTVIDYENLDSWLKREIIKLRRNHQIEKQDARVFWVDVDLWCINEESFLHNEKCYGLASEIIGDEWWRVLPEIDNHEYTYLCRVINAVKDGLKQQAALQAA